MPYSSSKCDVTSALKVHFASERNHGLASALATIPSLGGGILGQQNQDSVTNSSIITKLNQTSSVNRHGVQKPLVERAPRSLFLFTLDNKFRKG